MRFTDLDLSKHLHKALAALDYEETTPIQTQAIPPGLERRDIVGCAQTGTGKTLAFLVPAMDRLLRDGRKSKRPRVLVLGPTRELVVQVAGEARKLAEGSPLRVAPIYGGAKMGKQISQLKRGVDIIVATPGRLMDHMTRKTVDLRDIEVLVLDEADRMLDMGFLPDIKRIIRQVPEERQTMLYSATMPPAISALARHFQRDPVSIEIDMAQPPEAIRQSLYPVHRHLKAPLLLAMLEQMDIDSMLVFTRTKQEADLATDQLRRAGVSVACIHGDFRQRERTAALEGFRSGKHRVLVATNIAARGLDIEGISHVVNYDVPDQPEDYVHRIGRTARADADGDAITLVSPDDEPLVFRIEGLLGHKIERKTLPGFDYDVPVPSWAQPSAKALAKRASQNQSLAERWRSMS
jgi:ATP-dependent RNA helicase RhlE